MILLDANLLLYATISDFEQHEAARLWLDEQLNAPIRVGLPWSSLLAFLRISTNPRVFPMPLTMSESWRRVAAWLELDNVWIPEPTQRHQDLLEACLTGTGASSKFVSDAHLASIALGHGLTLCSTDGDFARFQALRWENPLAS